MAESCKTGWIKDETGVNFAPKTLSSQVITTDGVSLSDKLIELENNITTIESLEPEVSKEEAIIADILAVLPYKGTAMVEFTNGTADLEEGVSELAANTFYFVTE